jgi:hypothetical protein
MPTGSGIGMPAVLEEDGRRHVHHAEVRPFALNMNTSIHLNMQQSHRGLGIPQCRERVEVSVSLNAASVLRRCRAHRSFSCHDTPNGVLSMYTISHLAYLGDPSVGVKKVLSAGTLLPSHDERRRGMSVMNA